MTVPRIWSPAAGSFLCTGRKNPPAPGATPSRKFADYTAAALPGPPVNVDYYTRAYQALSQMYLNDQLGCCVEAGIAHLEGVFTINAGRPAAIYSNTGIVQMYSQMGGYVPGNPATDQGTWETVALLDWEQPGAPKAPHEIAGFLSVNAQDAREVRQCVWLFENVMYGFCLSDAWYNSAAPGFVWDAPTVPDLNLGHCVVGVGTNRQGIVVSTWGFTGTFTDRATSDVLTPRYGGELWCVLSQEIVNRATQKAPNGLNWQQLQTDFGLLS